VPSALGRSRTGLATVRSPHLPDAAPKAALALWTSKRKGSSCGSDTAEAKDRPQGSETSIMARHQGVQCKLCGQSISTGSADLALPIPLGPVHCPYCRQENLYLEQDRIEFDTENGLPVIDPA
jgi:hypothetical protein